MSYSTHILDWCIKDYLWRSDYVYTSADDTNRASIKTVHGKFNDLHHFITCISIQSKLCVNLCRVRCYRIINLSNGTILRMKVANQVFSGLSYDWHTLVVRNQFEQVIHDNEQDRKNLTLQFEFIFKKINEIELNQYLQTDLGTHLMNPAFSDITIKTSEGDEVPAHKILLVARSDVFRAQFQHDTAEKSTNTVVCPFETNVVKDLLSYIYQDMVPNIEETAFKLLVAADYYHLDHLKELCGYVLMKKLKVDNAIEMLTLAVTNNASYLKEDVWKFITDKENAPEIVQTEEWKSMSNELSKRILELILSP